jgi:hypothetical protein
MTINGFCRHHTDLCKRGLCEIKPTRMRGLSAVWCSEEQVLVDAVWEREPVIMLTRREPWDTLSDPVITPGESPGYRCTLLDCLGCRPFGKNVTSTGATNEATDRIAKQWSLVVRSRRMG